VPPERDRRRFGCSGRNLSVIPCQASQAGRLGEAGDLSSIPTGLLSVAAGVAAGLFEGIICEFLLWAAEQGGKRLER